MATVVQGRPEGERRYHERRRGWNASVIPAYGAGTRVSWGGIWGGVLVALGVLILLTALGLAVGVSAANPGQTEAETIGTAAGIWGGISLLIALFLGGWVATRIGAITDRTTGFFEGSLVWVLSLLIMAYAATSGVSTLASGAFRIVGGATQAVGQAVQSQGGIDLDVSGSVDQIAARLRDPQTAQRIASVTGLPVDNVRQTLEQTAQRVESNRDNPTEAANAARQGAAQLMQQARSSGALERQAERIQPQASQAAWITFGALVVSLLAAVIGAMVGRRRTVPAAAAPGMPAGTTD
ncbi:MAG TPA: hypothetical protein VFV10_18190 [Gammaproteobacteria bacterium]|nr:hypothetical protein [Gammaproteobacteria bacterium]